MKSQLKVLKEHGTLCFQTSKISKELFINVGYNIFEKYLDYPPSEYNAA